MEVELATTEYEALSDKTLVEAVVLMQEQAATIVSETGRMRFEIKRRIEAAGARQLAVEGIKVVLEHASPTYDHSRLNDLVGRITEEQYLDAFTPAHTKAVDVTAKWDGTKLRTLERNLGGPVAEIIQQARIPGQPQIIVERM